MKMRALIQLEIIFCNKWLKSSIILLVTILVLKIMYRHSHTFKNTQVTQYHQSLMTLFKIQDHLVLTEDKCKLSSPITMSEQLIYCVSENGDVLKINQGKNQVLFTILGCPSSIAFKGMTGGFLIADFAHQSIFLREDNQVEQITNLITEYKEKAFQGPSSIVINQFYSHMYFTDSGPFGETSLENKTGSVFLYIFEDKTLRAISYRNLAYPWGMALDQDEKFLLVCQFGENRILKFILDEECSGNCTVFHQFNGRAGPSVICFHNQLYFCALYQYKDLTINGMVAVLGQNGDLIEKIKLPCGPEITGLTFIQPSLQSTKQKNDILLITESNKIHQIRFKGEKNELGDESEGVGDMIGRN